MKFQCPMKRGFEGWKRVGATMLEEQRHIPDPKVFDGAQNAEEVENFLWDMETYFHAAGVPDDEMVSVASKFLSGEAILWWRARVSDDASAKRDRINTWETLKGVEGPVPALQR